MGGLPRQSGGVCDHLDGAFSHTVDLRKSTCVDVRVEGWDGRVGLHAMRETCPSTYSSRNERIRPPCGCTTTLHKIAGGRVLN